MIIGNYSWGCSNGGCKGREGTEVVVEGSLEGVEGGAGS